MLLQGLEPAKVRQHRVLLVGRRHFRWLKTLQEHVPGPRLDLRYLLEGALAVLQGDEALRAHWLEAARAALLGQLAQNESGTGRGPAVAEGAQARTPAPPLAHVRNAGRIEDCKALQVGEEAFLGLKRVQGTTRDPRLEMRYLVEGAVVLLQQRADLLPRVVGQARQALSGHLAQLQTQPVEPIRMEIQQ
jgi:hypothetical protein